MAISRYVLPFLVILIFTVSMANSLTFIEISCSATSYPELCVESLSPYAYTIQQSRFQMGLTAMTVSLANGQSAKSFLDQLLPGPVNKLCFVDEIVDEVGKTVVNLTTTGGASTTKLETLLSSPLDAEECFDRETSLLDTVTQDMIRTRVTNLAQVTSNAVVLVNKI